MSTYRLFPCRLLRREQVSTSFVRITLGGDLAEVSDALGDQRVKLLLADADTLAGLAQAPDWYQAWRDSPVPAARAAHLHLVWSSAG